MLQPAGKTNYLYLLSLGRIWLQTSAKNTKKKNNCRPVLRFSPGSQRKPRELIKLLRQSPGFGISGRARTGGNTTIDRKGTEVTWGQRISSICHDMFSGLSLVLWIKTVCDWTGQTLNLSELKGERPAEPDLIHTSCRSESSNISLVVLDKLTVSSLEAQLTLMGGVHFQWLWSLYFKQAQMGEIIPRYNRGKACRMFRNSFQYI